MESSKNFRVIFLAIMMSMILGVNAAEARPSNDKIIQWLNKHLANVAGGVDEEDGAICRDSYGDTNGRRASTMIADDYHYTFLMEGNLLVVEDVKDSLIQRRLCNGRYTKQTSENTSVYSIRRVDLSTATTISEKQIVTADRVDARWPTSVQLEGETIVVGRFDSDVELADKVRRALNDLILNSGGAEPLY